LTLFLDSIKQFLLPHGRHRDLKEQESRRLTSRQDSDCRRQYLQRLLDHMATNSVMQPCNHMPKTHNKKPVKSNEVHVSLLLSTCILLAALVGTTSWARRWLFSGAAAESLLLLIGGTSGTRIFPGVHLWTFLATLNLIYAICSTSWLLYWCFTFGCYPLIAITTLWQSALVADIVRRTLRKVLRELHFTRDKIAFFGLPALEIDVDVNGLMVVRGVTFSLSNLSIVAHGVEVGLKLADEIEMSICADEVHVALLRNIQIGDIFANIKGGKLEMTFIDLENENADSNKEDDSIFLGDTPLLRAATAGSAGFQDRPSLRHFFSGVKLEDSSLKEGLDTVTTLSPDDEMAEKQYMDILADIRTTSAVYRSRQAVTQKARSGKYALDTEKDMRAAICTELHDLPSIIHPPPRSVRVSTLKSLSKPSAKIFMHRLPFLLRLLLSPLGYFHPISINSINAAGSGKWLTALLQHEVFKNYDHKNAELRRLFRKVSTWLADARFCFQLTEIDGLGQVPLSTNFDIVAYLRCGDIMAYRTALVNEDEQATAGEISPPSQSRPSSSGAGEAGKSRRPSKQSNLKPDAAITQVVRLGGADARFTIPSFLLPHHEHIFPPKPSSEDEQNQSFEVTQADGKPKAAQAEKKLDKIRKDEASITMSVHGSLPACFDQTLLNFTAALVKATKIVELEKAADDAETDDGATLPDDVSIASGDFSFSRTNSGFKAFTKNIRQGMKDGSARDVIKDFAKDLHQTTRDNFKKAVVGGMVNDLWIAKMVGKVAANLEKAQGDLGYSGEIPIPLERYRRKAEKASKLLP
jgi:hypothetical protein